MLKNAGSSVLSVTGTPAASIWRIGWVARPTDADRRDNVACHKAIAAAIADHDVRLAEEKMSEHFDNTVKVLLAAGIN